MFRLSLIYGNFCYVTAVFWASLSNTDLAQPRSFSARPCGVSVAIIFVLMQIRARHIGPACQSSTGQWNR
jgi:hypothetical protein